MDIYMNVIKEPGKRNLILISVYLTFIVFLSGCSSSETIEKDGFIYGVYDNNFDLFDIKTYGAKEEEFITGCIVEMEVTETYGEETKYRVKSFYVDGDLYVCDEYLEEEYMPFGFVCSSTNTPYDEYDHLQIYFERQAEGPAFSENLFD